MLDKRDTNVNDIIPMITSNLAIQGGDYCLKGTSITVDGIIEAMREGYTIKDMVEALEKYWKCLISEEDLKEAIKEYNMRLDNLYYCKN